MQYGFKAHAVKREAIALQPLEQTLELGLQLRFTMRFFLGYRWLLLLASLRKAQGAGI